MNHNGNLNMKDIHKQVSNKGITGHILEWELIDGITSLFPDRFFNIEFEPISNPIKNLFVNVYTNNRKKIKNENTLHNF